MGCSETEMQIEKLKESIRNGEMTIEELKDRLHLIIETELLKDDEEVDIELVKACESFFVHLHGNEKPLSEEEDKKLWAKIQDSVKTDRTKKRTVRKVPVYAAIAVAAIIILFFGISIRFQWFLPSSTPDGQQYVITGKQISIDTISKAIASHDEFGAFETAIQDEMEKYLGFSLSDILPVIENWEIKSYQVTILPEAIYLRMTLINTSVNENELIYTIHWVTDYTNLNYTLEQDGEGRIIKIGSQSVYRSVNYGDVSYTWLKEHAFYVLTGSEADTMICKFVERSK